MEARWGFLKTIAAQKVGAIALDSKKVAFLEHRGHAIRSVSAEGRGPGRFQQ
jgi:hypothetical protein